MKWLDIEFYRNKYWDYSRDRATKEKLKLPENDVFAKQVASEQKNYPLKVPEHISNEIDQRLEAAIQWLLLARNARPDNGVSLGYFPLEEQGGWKPSYPETTGYIITTMLKFGRLYGRQDITNAALAMAEWEIEVQMASGAAQGGPVCAAEKQTAAAFNTGMVLDGLCSAYDETKKNHYLQSAEKAAVFLVDDLDQDGYFQTNGDFVSQEKIKTYTCLCAWAMYRAGQLMDSKDIKEAAIRSVEAAMRQQQDNGWFAHNCLTQSHMPLTHTIGYVIQGVLEVGILAERSDFIGAAERALKAAVDQQTPTGFLAGRLDGDWRPVSKYVCLTGSAQLAISCYRLALLFDKNELVPLANKLVDFVLATQLVDSQNDNVNGAIAGSYPISGDYMTYGYPNWATKYLSDALMLRKQILGT